MALFALPPDGQMQQEPLKTDPSDTDRIKRMSKDELVRYCKDHFLDTFTIDPTESLAKCRKQVTDFLDRQLGAQVALEHKEPVPSEEVKRVIEKEPEVDDQAQDINPDGSPKFVIAKANNMVWPTNSSTLDHLMRHPQAKMRDYTPCDRRGRPLMTERLGARYRGTT